jgi:hypothetical protein
VSRENGKGKRENVVAQSAAAVVVLTASIWFGLRYHASSDSSQDARRIHGGNFEASGVVSVSGTNGVLIVDDGRGREVLWMELNPDGSQNGAVVRVPIGSDVVDPEGITTDGRSYYVVGSQSKPEGADADDLVRFTFDAKTKRTEAVERVKGLRGWLAEHVPELRSSASQVGEDVLNIEGLAWDPRNRRLLLGLRAPVVGGDTLIVPIKLTDPAAQFSLANMRLDGNRAIHLPLGGAGIRSLEFDEAAGAFLLITGNSLDERRDFRLLEWKGSEGAESLRELSRFPRTHHPEGVAAATLGGKRARVIVFDDGQMTVTF